MGSENVQFREAAEELSYLRARGLSPNEFGRDAFRAALRRLKAQEAMDTGAKTRARLPRSAADLVRADRDRR